MILCDVMTLMVVVVFVTVNVVEQIKNYVIAVVVKKEKRGIMIICLYDHRRP